MPRFLWILCLTLFTALTGCGLSERERAVADSNEAIRQVEQVSQEVAQKIADLPDAPLTPENVGGLREAVGRYLGQMEKLNVALRALGPHYPALQGYLNESFRPSAEAAAANCQEAIDSLAAPSTSQEDYRKSITRIGLCIERYATAVTNLAAEYNKLTG